MRTVSSKFLDTQVPSISTEKLVLPRHARCVLSRLRCNGHSQLLCSHISRTGEIENFSCSAYGHLSSHSALSSYELFGDSLSLYDLWSRPGELSGFWSSMSPAMPPSLGRGRVATTTTTVNLVCANALYDNMIKQFLVYTDDDWKHTHAYCSLLSDVNPRHRSQKFLHASSVS